MYAASIIVKMPLASIQAQRPGNCRRCAIAYMSENIPSTAKYRPSTSLIDVGSWLGQIVKTVPATSAAIADTSDHQKPGACRAPSVMIKPTAPLKKKRQPSNIVTTTAANPGITIAATPRNKSKLPSIGSSVRARARDSCNSCAVDAPVVLDSFIRYAP